MQFHGWETAKRAGPLAVMLEQFEQDPRPVHIVYASRKPVAAIAQVTSYEMAPQAPCFSQVDDTPPQSSPELAGRALRICGLSRPRFVVDGHPMAKNHLATFPAREQNDCDNELLPIVEARAY